MNPLHLLDTFDYLICFLGILLRLLASFEMFKQKNPDKAPWRYVLDWTYLLRWGLHLVTVAILMLALPILFDDHNIIGGWSYLGSACVGILGYDAWKWIIKGGTLLLKKTFGIDLKPHCEI